MGTPKTAMERALEVWHLDEHLHLPRTGSDASVGFEAGWQAARADRQELVACVLEMVEAISSGYRADVSISSGKCSSLLLQGDSLSKLDNALRLHGDLIRKLKAEKDAV